MPILAVLPAVAYFVRVTVFAVVALAAVLALGDWLVRTRRINPFHPLARGFRRAVDPLLAPVERRIVRAGGLPTSAPLWALAVVVVLGIVLISVVDFALGAIVSWWLAAASGPRGIFVVLVRATFGLLELALLVRVVVSWLPVSPYSAWVRWSFALTEPILRPLRGVVPQLGMLDVTPIVAYFLLELVEWAFLRL